MRDGVTGFNILEDPLTGPRFHELSYIWEPLYLWESATS